MRPNPLQSFFIIWSISMVSPQAQNNAISMYESEQLGDATYFVESPAGNCSVSPTLPVWGEALDFQVALSDAQYRSGDQSAGCGTCLEGTYLGTGSGGNPPPKVFTGLVVDRCPACESGDLDLALNGADGRWDVSWRATDCPVDDSNLAYLFQGSNPFYLKLGVRNHRIAIKALQIQSQAGTPFVTATRTTDNFFTCSACPEPLEFPMTVRVMAVNGEIINDWIPELTNNVLLNGINNQQFLSINDFIYKDIFEYPAF